MPLANVALKGTQKVVTRVQKQQRDSIPCSLNAHFVLQGLQLHMLSFICSYPLISYWRRTHVTARGVTTVVISRFFLDLCGVVGGGASRALVDGLSRFDAPELYIPVTQIPDHATEPGSGCEGISLQHSIRDIPMKLLDSSKLSRSACVYVHTLLFICQTTNEFSIAGGPFSFNDASIPHW